MRQVTGSMGQVVRGMEGAMKAMDLEKVRHPSALPPSPASPLTNPHPPLDISRHGQIRDPIRRPGRRNRLLRKRHLASHSGRHAARRRR